jgi:peptidoglycan/LPS O-acetylase OafA/YrhL
LQDLPQNLLMIHAWGTTPHVGWNFPSWSVSAEWAAYLAFPVLAALALKGKRRPGATLALTLGAAMASVAALDVLHTLPGLGHLGQGFSEMTAQIGALRILPTFLLGIALYQFGRVRSPGLGWPLAGAGAALVLGVTLLDAHDAFAWPGFCALILGLAETARQGREGLFASRAFVFLGAASYALYMTHLGVDIVAFELLARLGITEESSLVVRAGAVAGAMLASILVAALAYLWLEEPARNAIRAWPNRAPPGWPRLTPRPAPRP